MGFELPFLPVDTPEEVKLFNKLALKFKESGNLSKVLDFDKMAIEWCDYVDGTTIFPKLPVYLRSYHPNMLANQFMRAQTQSMVSSGQEQQLSKLFDTTASVMHNSEKNLSYMSISNTGSNTSLGQSSLFF